MDNQKQLTIFTRRVTKQESGVRRRKINSVSWILFPEFCVSVTVALFALITLTAGNAGASSVTSLDFNTESDWAQEDGAKTDIAGGAVTLLCSGGVSATGGTVTTVGGYTIHAFTSSGTFNVSAGGNVEYLVVAGGGGGGYGYYGAGGGAGGLLYDDTYAVTTGEKSVVVGGGGSGSVSGAARGSNGENSSFDGIAATGGGGGCGYVVTTAAAGANGGSGGGSGHYSQSYGTGVSGQGYNGGACTTGQYGAGGGGAGGPGASGTGSGGTAPGGDGLDFSAIFGTTYGDPAYPGWFAGGGGGAKWENHSDGGKGGGGIGGGWSPVVQSTAGAANTGGGGGGGRGNGEADSSGKAGGSGIVLIRYGLGEYPTTQSYYITTASGAQIDTSLWDTVDSVSIDETTPANTSTKYLVSFDGRNTWQYWTGSAWSASSLNDLQTNGMSKTAVEAISGSQWASASGFVLGTLDFAIDLNTADPASTPQLNGIDVNYSTQSYDYVYAGLDSLSLGYTAPQKEDLYQLYKNGKAGLEPENITIGDTEWQYYDSEFLPGEDPENPYAIGTAYTYLGKQFIKLGSGIGEPLGGVPELPAGVVPVLGVIFGVGVKRLRRFYK